jgi:hypothetical protein
VRREQQQEKAEAVVEYVDAYRYDKRKQRLLLSSMLKHTGNRRRGQILWFSMWTHTGREGEGRDCCLVC